MKSRPCDISNKKRCANTSLEDAGNVHWYRYDGAQLYNYEPVRHQRGQVVMSAFKCHLLSFGFLSPIPDPPVWKNCSRRWKWKSCMYRNNCMSCCNHTFLASKFQIWNIFRNVITLSITEAGVPLFPWLMSEDDGLWDVPHTSGTFLSIVLPEQINLSNDIQLSVVPCAHAV